MAVSTINAVNAATSSVVISTGKVLASAPVILGNAAIDVGKFRYLMSANVKVYDVNHSAIESTPAVQTVCGVHVFCCGQHRCAKLSCPIQDDFLYRGVKLFVCDQVS